MVDAETRKIYNAKYYQRHRDQAKKKYEATKEQSKEQEDKEISEHLEKFPLDLNYGQKPVRDSFPSFGQWLAENSGKSWSDYISERNDFINDQPRELTDEEMQPFLNAMNDGLCARCKKPLPEGYDGKVCMDCRLKMS